MFNFVTQWHHIKRLGVHYLFNSVTAASHQQVWGRIAPIQFFVFQGIQFFRENSMNFASKYKVHSGDEEMYKTQYYCNRIKKAPRELTFGMRLHSGD